MSSFFASIKRAFGQPFFLVAVLVLGICAGTLNTAAGMLKLKFQKLPVRLRVDSLKAGVPQKLGHWISVSPDTAIDPEVEQVLGTSQYIFRDYIDTRKFTPEQVNELKNASGETRQAKLAVLQMEKPSAVMRVAITYYTGLVDTVAHVPERCYVADGFEVKQYDVKKASLGNFADGSPRDVEFRFIAFEDQTSMGRGVERMAQNVGYVFHCNGKYEASAYEVRRRLQNLFEPYGYYAKVELMTAATMNPSARQGDTAVNDKDDSVAAMENFLSEALPEIEKCLPDWQSLHNKKK